MKKPNPISESVAALFDVIAVDIETGTERFIAEKLSKANAEAIVKMAVLRRGVDAEFFQEVPHPYVLKNKGEL